MYQVAVDGLNLRSKPNEKGRQTVIAVLHRGEKVKKLANAKSKWWEVEVEIGGKKQRGFVAHRFLKPAVQLVEDVHHGGVPAVHLTHGKGSRSAGRHRAFPLGEQGQPRRAARTAKGKAKQCLRILDHLNVSRSARYRPKSGTTYCNIYAYDYCYLGNAYLPRVWWTDRALTQLLRGERVPVRYGATVREMTANRLCDWLAEWGDDFGWERTTSLTELQDAANAGRIGVICASRVDRHRPGHISAVIPESASFEAIRNAGGEVLNVVESQAGGKNYKRRHSTGWWRATRFATFGYWHADATREAVSV